VKIKTKAPLGIVSLSFVFLISIETWGMTSAELEADIRDATTGCPAFTITPPSTGGATVDASTYGVNPGNTGAQNYTDFTNAIAHCKSQGAYKLTVPKATYYIGQYGKSYGNGILYFNGLHDFIFDGEGSTFIMQSKSDFVEVMNCSRVALQNYTMNWDWSLEPVQSLTTVVNIATNGAYIDLYYPYESNPATNSLLYELDEVSEFVETNETDYYFSHNGAGIIGVGDVATSKTTSLGNSTLRFYTSKGNGWFYDRGFRLGQYYLLRHYSYEYPGNDIEYNNNLTFSNVTVYSTLGMGFSLNDNQYYQVINSRLVREPGSIYHLSSASDGVNISKSYGYFKLQNDEIANCGDDNINIHDGTSEGVNVTGPNTLIASNCIDWRNPYATGDIVELRKGDYTPWSWSSALTAVSAYSNNDTVKLTFADNLPAGLTADSILFNHTYNSGNYVISGCYIHDSKGKGAFLHTANGTVENNQFIHNYNPGLFIASINSYYSLGSSYGEGYNPSNIIVQSNTFDGNNIIRNNGVTDTYFPNDIVLVGQTGPESIAAYPICNNIIFEYNLVKNSTHASMEIASATNVLVENNTFENPCLTNDDSSVLGSVMILKSSSVIFSTNDLVVDAGVTSYKTNIYVDTATATNNIFAFPFASVTIDAGPPVIDQDLEPAYSTAFVGATNTFSINVAGSQPIARQWYQNGLPIVDATNQDYTFAVLDGTNTYYCAVTNSYSAGVPTESSTATVVGIPSPVLNPANYSSQLKIVVNGYNRTETLNDFPVLVELGSNVPNFSYSQFASPSGGDLRFTDASGTREIPYEINQWNPNGVSSIWVQMPIMYGTNDISGNSNIIYAYWGNPADIAPPDYTTNGAVWLWAAPSYEVVYHLEQNGFPYFDSTLQYPATGGIAPASATGIIGEAASFSHTPYLDAGFVNLGGAFTLSAWVNVPATATSIQTIWGNGDGVAESAECLFYVDNYNTSDGSLILTTGDGGATEHQLKSATGAVSFNQWHLVTAVVDRTDGGAQLYVDANQVASGPAMTDFPINTDMDLGQDNGGSFQYRGLIDEARIRSGLSSTNWIWASYMTVAQNSAFENYSSVISPAATLRIQLSGNNVILFWPDGTLQSAGQVAGPYSDVAGAMSPYTNTVSQTQQFYRVRPGE
jgi:hypothetical protein